MGHLCMAAAECGYKEIDQQLREQFIHRLNDRVMLDDIIRELTSKTNSDQTTSKDVLAWAKRVKAQSMQASVLNDITETKTFDKIKNAPESKNTWGGRESNIATHQRWPCRYCGAGHTPTQCPAYGKTCTACGKTGHYRKVCSSKRNHTVHEVEIEMGPDSQGEDIQIVSMQVGETALEIPYKINTGSEGNLMPLYIFKKNYSKT